jgi:3'(2'), 5'-bisphosphate nucleotidase
MVNIGSLIAITHLAGQAVMLVYNQSKYEIITKPDNSALTTADTHSHTILCDALHKLYPAIPIISEESALQQSYDKREHWEYCFLVDPLDGTKEFIQRNDEFTINIALIRNHQPVLGIIHAPALDITYYAELGKGAYKMSGEKHIALSPQVNTNNNVRVAVSRSHDCPATKNFLAELAKEGKIVSTIAAGSALKFGLIAEGKADIYPRPGTTMEWDTAAGQIIVNEIGKKVTLLDSDKQLQYNKANLLNPGFIVR